MPDSLAQGEPAAAVPPAIHMQAIQEPPFALGQQQLQVSLVSLFPLSETHAR